MQKRKNYLAFGSPSYTNEEIDAVTRVMRSGWVGMGPETILFEKELADFIGATEVITVNSCTSALFLALLAEGVGCGDEVIVPSLTWRATANAALYVGATPVFCDVDYNSMCLSSETVISKLSPKTKAVIVVHYGGYAVDVEELRKNLPKNVAIIEDAAHALGSSFSNQRLVGSSGNLTCFSFYANKNLATAEGGAIALFDELKAKYLRSMRMGGMDSNAWSRYTNPKTHIINEIYQLGYKMNYTDLQASIGRIQLKRLKAMAQVRKQIATRYRDQLDLLGINIHFQNKVFENEHARHLLVGRINSLKLGIDRDTLFLALRDYNIGSSIHYRPLHLEPLYRDSRPTTLPITEHLYTQIITLPISANMSLNDVDYVVDVIAIILKKYL